MNRDVFQKMNHLYQIGQFMASLEEKEKEEEEDNKELELSQFYLREVSRVCAKHVSRLTPQLKRHICPNCHSSLLTKTAKVRIKGKTQHRVILTCKKCKNFRRFHCKKTKMCKENTKCVKKIPNV
mmetsp:Transcript_8440/g.12844  ORF Transcript_8440/g.12844 Transcript_8440/m.12844 type:complete len:125 (+) Transcript_8440:2-376(+)